MVKAISGVKTVRFKNEIERNITIKLGYANAKIYKLASAAEGVELGDGPGRYTSRSSNTADSFETEEGTWALERHVSFVDCPGHVSLWLGLVFERLELRGCCDPGDGVVHCRPAVPLLPLHSDTCDAMRCEEMRGDEMRCDESRCDEIR